MMTTVITTISSFIKTGFFYYKKTMVASIQLLFLTCKFFLVIADEYIAKDGIVKPYSLKALK